MTGNPKSSRWRSPSNANRARKQIQFTLSPEAIARLEELAPEGSRSALVEHLIMTAPRQGSNKDQTP